MRRQLIQNAILGGVTVLLARRLGAESVASFFLAWEAIFVWNVVFPLLGGLERIIRQPGAWGELLGVLLIAGSYYFLLRITLPVARKLNPKVHPISTAYLGGWWLVILLAALSVLSPAYDSVLGLSMATSGANLIFITLFVGTAKFWVDGYLKPPPRADTSETTKPIDPEAPHDRSA